MAAIVNSNPDNTENPTDTPPNSDNTEEPTDTPPNSDGSTISEPNNKIDDASDSGISPTGERIFEDSSNIKDYNDVDLIKIELNKGQVAVIDVDVDPKVSKLDSELRVFNTDGKEVAVSLDNAAVDETQGTDSYLEFTAPANGEYSVGISTKFDSYDPLTGEIDPWGADGGDYNLSITVFNGITGTTSGDKLTGKEKADYLTGLKGNDTLVGGNGDDFLTGGKLNDNLQGNQGNDTLLGGGDNDILEGGKGDDILKGGDGNDVLTGGDGADQFILVINQTGETIKDFNVEQDSLRVLGGIDYSALIISPGSGDAVIKYNDPNVDKQITLATLENVDSESLTETNFLF